MNPRTTSLRRPRPFWTLAALLLATSLISSTAYAQGGLALSNGVSTIGELKIGDDLFVRLPLMLPLTPLELHVLDESQQSVASLAPLVVPANHLTPVALWLRTGVVGCDVPGVQDILDYHFRDFQEASAHLAGRTFTVELRFANGTPIQSIPLPIKARPTSGQGALYFSDSSGCPRSAFNGTEPVYLSGFRSYFPNGAAVFLVDPEHPTDSNNDVIEVRDAYSFSPQVIPASIANGDWTHLLWSAPSIVSGDYGAIVGSAQGRSGFSHQTMDNGVGSLEDPYYDETNVHGITIIDVECADCDPINWRWGLNSP